MKPLLAMPMTRVGVLIAAPAALPLIQLPVNAPWETGNVPVLEPRTWETR